MIFLEFNHATNSLKSWLRFIGLLGIDQIEKDYQALLWGVRMVVFVIRFAGFGEGVNFLPTCNVRERLPSFGCCMLWAVGNNRNRTCNRL
jgi:hypothetical protein